MSESSLPQKSADASGWEDASGGEEIPQFGAVDIVEAFTAMRHEWRGQTKESRALAEQVQAVASNLQALESKLLARAAERQPDNSTETRQLALALAETDHQLSRAAAALAKWETNRKLGEAADARAVEQCFAAMNWLARRLARPLWALIAERRLLQESAPEDAAVGGLNMVAARHRRMMREQGIERVDVEGKPFDAESMYAIGTVESAGCPSGHVAEQLSPAYRWQGKLLRFADVRIAK